MERKARRGAAEFSENPLDCAPADLMRCIHTRASTPAIVEFSRGQKSKNNGEAVEEEDFGFTLALGGFRRIF